MASISERDIEKVNDDRIWETVKEDIPELKSKVEAMLKREGIDTK